MSQSTYQASVEDSRTWPAPADSWNEHCEDKATSSSNLGDTDPEGRRFVSVLQSRWLYIDLDGTIFILSLLQQQEKYDFSLLAIFMSVIGC